MKNNVYLSVCVFSMAVAVAWWSLDRSNSKSQPDGSADLVIEGTMTVNQQVDSLNDDAGIGMGWPKTRRSEEVELKIGKDIKVTGERQDSLAAIEKPLSGDDSRVDDHSSEIELGSVDKSAPHSQAVRLADDFALPSAMMHMVAIEAGHGGSASMTPQIKAAVDHLVDDFYRDVAQVGELGSNATAETEVSAQEQSEFNTNNKLAEVTRVIAPTEEAMQATEKANQSHQLLFGDEAANRFGVQSKLEARLPVQGQE